MIRISKPINYILFFIFFIASVYKPTQYSFKSLWAVALISAYLRRKNEIGGWLFVYLIVLFGGSIIFLPQMIPLFSYYTPSVWDDKSLYIQFIALNAPIMVLTLGQIIIGAIIFIKKFRSWKLVKLLRVILGLEIGFILIKIVTWQAEPQLRPADITPDIVSLIWPSIWLLYFIFSKRIRRVFLTKDWGVIKLSDSVILTQ